MQAIPAFKIAARIVLSPPSMGLRIETKEGLGFFTIPRELVPNLVKEICAVVTHPALVSTEKTGRTQAGYAETPSMPVLRSTGSLAHAGETIVVAFQVPGGVEFRFQLPLEAASDLGRKLQNTATSVDRSNLRGGSEH